MFRGLIKRFVAAFAAGEPVPRPNVRDLGQSEFLEAWEDAGRPPTVRYHALGALDTTYVTLRFAGPQGPVQTTVQSWAGVGYDGLGLDPLLVVLLLESECVDRLA